MKSAAAVQQRAEELGGEVVEMEFRPCSQNLEASGVVRWKRPNPHLPNGEEHISHYFYVWPNAQSAVFEAGIYGDEESVTKKHRERCL